MLVLSDLHHALQESGKRKAEDPEAVALVSDDIIAKRQARFKTQEESAEEQRKQRFMDPDTLKAKERKERFGKWLPQESAGKNSKDDVAAAIGTSLDNSMPSKGRARAGSAASAPKEEKYSAEFTAKAEVCLLLLHCRDALVARGTHLGKVYAASALHQAHFALCVSKPRLAAMFYLHFLVDPFVDLSILIVPTCCVMF